jgi:hypothetical protein
MPVGGPSALTWSPVTWDNVPGVDYLQQYLREQSRTIVE